MAETIIKDSIYRFVKIPKLCKLFIDTPEFNRLRRIKQLGLAHFVYPAASHTRFEHCIGVMHLTGKVADLLISQNNTITQREKDLLQLAGLLHDVGHVAFSHLMDYIAEENNLSLDLAHHEYRSITILKQINNRIKALTEEEINIVCKMILGDCMNASKPFLFEIVNNKAYGLDTDKLDYLQRDLYHLGMTCFQPDYILECLRIKNTNDIHNHLAVLEKAKPEIEMMYEARKRLLLLVCRHKTVMKVEKILRKAIERIEIIKNFEKIWQGLDDYKIHCMMEEICPELLNQIYTRNWDKIIVNHSTDHIKYVTKDEIKLEIDKVLWI